MWIVTGATGFIGSALVWELNEQGRQDVILVCDHVPPEERPGLLKKRTYTEFVKAGALFDFMEKNAARIEGVYHMGACSTTTETDEAYLQRNNVEYSQKVWDFCTRHGKPLIYASSAATYGDGKNGFDDARDPKDYQPLNLYGWSKLKFDIWALEQKKTPPRWYGLRFFNVYGPNEYHKGEQASVAFKAYNQIRETGRLKLFKSYNPKYKDGEQLRDFVYVKDITRWMREMMDRAGTPSQGGPPPAVVSGIYNMGAGKARTWLNLAGATFEAMGRKMDIDWIEVPANIRDQYQYFTEAKMDRLLAQGLSVPQWPLEKGVADYVKTHLSQKDPYL
jgi:ADP-L-glycero-D-manno-heptose 6-epimerase